MALPKQRKIVRLPVVDKTKPQKDCRGCSGKGAYPAAEQNGIPGITIRMGKSEGPPLPCKSCHQ